MGQEDISHCIKSSDDGLYLDVRVSPGSEKNEITGINSWRDQLEVSVEEEAREGKANRALTDFFSDLFDMTRKDVKIVKGRTAKNKRLYFVNLDKSRLMEEIRGRVEGK